jgi:hypothetical protein
MGMMYLRNIFLLITLLFGGNTVFGQSKDLPNASSVHSEVGKEIKIIADDSAKLGQKDVYHQRGDRMEQLLSDGQSTKDDRLPEQNFIIERSPQIKIEYTPARSRSGSKTEKPL